MSSLDYKIKRELDTVYVTSDGRKFLKYMDALCAESQMQQCIDSKLSKKKRIMDVVELIMEVLKSENWGVYYKNQPIQPLETQDGSALYRVNQVDESEIEKVIEEKLTKGNPWRESSQMDSSQKKTSDIG